VYRIKKLKKAAKVQHRAVEPERDEMYGMGGGSRMIHRQWVMKNC
jgi:hypothetical protein